VCQTLTVSKSLSESRFRELEEGGAELTPVDHSEIRSPRSGIVHVFDGVGMGEAKRRTRQSAWQKVGRHSGSKKEGSCSR
jgi:hypothetical protein